MKIPIRAIKAGSGCNLEVDVNVNGSLVNANKVYERGFYVGNSCRNIKEQTIGLYARLRDFIK